MGADHFRCHVVKKKNHLPNAKVLGDSQKKDTNSGMHPLVSEFSYPTIWFEKIRGPRAIFETRPDGLGTLGIQ